jgi:maleate cis-trans isomerase
MIAEQLNIGFISPGPATWPHYDSFMALVPEFVKFDFQGLGLYGKSLYEISGKKAAIVARISELALANDWQAAIVIGAPTEVMNPGLLADLKAALPIPVTTALGASVAALRKYSAKRLLLLTPFETRLNQMIEDYLSDAGFAVSAPRSFGNIGAAGRLSPDEVFQLTQQAFAEVGEVDAIYFQGAVLDPLKVLEKIETELKTIAIASNPAMLWDSLSQLGRRAPVNGYGRLLAEWPVRTDECCGGFETRPYEERHR